MRKMQTCGQMSAQAPILGGQNPPWGKWVASAGLRNRDDLPLHNRQAVFPYSITILAWMLASDAARGRPMIRWAANRRPRGKLDFAIACQPDANDPKSASRADSTFCCAVRGTALGRYGSPSRSSSSTMCAGAVIHTISREFN